MPIFQYKALTEKGKETAGIIDADSPRQARERLRHQKIHVTEKVICALKGKWTGWDFRFMAQDDVELAHVTKKWAGLGKELFTSADNYVLEIKDSVAQDDPVRMLIMAAVMCIDMVLKE